MITIIPPPRNSDRWGSGNYGASRDGGNRSHNGIDLACMSGSIVLSHVSGKVTKLGYPYSPHNSEKGHFRYVEVTDNANRKHRFFYIQPRVEVGTEVGVDRPLGITQTLQKVYPGITDHIHYEVLVDGIPVDPEEWLI